MRKRLYHSRPAIHLLLSTEGWPGRSRDWEIALRPLLKDSSEASAFATARYAPHEKHNDVAAALEKSEFRYVQSHQNDPMGCAVAHEVLRVIEEESLVERSAALGNRFLMQLREMSKECGLLTEARGRGLMVAIEFAAAESNPAALAYEEMLGRGFLIGYNPRSRVIRFLPPLTIGEKEIENVVENLRSVLQSLI